MNPIAFRSLICLSALIFCLAGCAHSNPKLAEERNPLAKWVPSENHNARKAVIIVLHATEQGSVEASLDTLRGSNLQGPVSAHYLIGRDGALYQLVSEDRRAWHAGGGRWGTITDLNSASIGIELDNDGGSDFPEPQLDSLIGLLGDLCTRLDIPRTQVIGHADLAPWRKTDPGTKFPWQRLAQAGFGRWPDPALVQAPAGFDGWIALQLVGYPMRDPQAALRAFRLHYRALDDATSPMGPEDLTLLFALTSAERSAGQAATARASIDSSQASSEPSETPSNRKADK